MHSISPTPNSNGDGGPTGCLFIVATPIGHMDDITVRALKTLGGVDLIAAEDTRHTKKLLDFHGIRASLISFHEHNEEKRVPALIDQLKAGKTIALVSDAGTPSISDPGYRLVRAAVENGINTVPVPGVSAVLTALSASGLPTDSFVFAGFLPKKKGKRQRFLNSLAGETRTIIFYESPRRIITFLQDLETLLGDRHSVLCREMTKLHEEFIRGPLSDIRRVLCERPSVKGECTLIVSGADHHTKVPLDSLRDEIRSALKSAENSPSHLSKQLASKYGLPRSRVYEEILAVKDERDQSKPIPATSEDR